MKWTYQIAVLHPNLVRVACLPEGQKKVEPTFAVRDPERFRPVKVRATNGRVEWKNACFRIHLHQDGSQFSGHNLSVEWVCDGQTRSWRPGELDHENLGGNFHALDLLSEERAARGTRPFDPMKGPDAYVNNPGRPVYFLLTTLARHLGRQATSEEFLTEYANFVNGKPPKVLDRWPREFGAILDSSRLHPPGYLSRAGASVFLDSSLPWDPQRDWIRKRKTPQREQQVLYLLHYGRDFKSGVSLIADLLGPIPTIPEWILGVWFSCYRVMGEKEFVKLKNDFDKYDLPLDVVVVDTDWHRAYWHGFDWNKKLFPDPKRFARLLKDKDLHTAFNVHPEYIPKGDSGLPEFLRRTGAEEVYTDDATAPFPNHKNCLPIDMLDRDQALAYFDVFHPKIEKTGCDLWWIDAIAREDLGHGYTTFLNETYHLHAQKAASDYPRVVLSRAYGLGAHRSTLLFTGDTLSQWATLEQEVVVTQKAANCLLSYVSHDLGGFSKGSREWKINKPSDDLFIRWCQFGAFSPVFRLHSDHGVREPWKFRKKTLQIVRKFLWFRKCLTPYLLDLVREANATGVSLCRPMYYEFPEYEESYAYEKQYMLGPALLVSPVTNAGGWATMWFPPGVWQHAFQERVVMGPAVLCERVAIDDMPVYVRVGFPVDHLTLGDLKAAHGKGRRRRPKPQVYKPESGPLARAMEISEV